MKTILSTAIISFMLISFISNAQDITNTLAPGGNFKIKDATTDFFILNQSNGTITLPLQLGSSQQSAIFKGSNRFLHTYFGAGTNGNNLFLGIDAGNFTMGGVNSNDGSYNSGVGPRSLFYNSTGSRNSAFGFQSLYYNTTGTDNSAFGLNSLLFNTSGNGNSAFGRASLYSNTTGINNTAIGFGALNSNDAGNNATAIGYNAMFYTNNTLAAFNNFNVAVGYEALRGSTIPANNTGNRNTAVGYITLQNNSTGSDNSAFGFSSNYLNSTGSDNSSFGSYSLNSNTTGYENSAIGRSSLYANTTGFRNSAFGTGAGQFISSGSNLTCIGYNAQPTSGSATNQITLGNSSVTSLRCAVTTITALSDARDKKNIKDLNLGIDFLMKLKPRQYNWDKREWYENNISDGSKMNEEPTAGFIAQELDEAQINANAEWLNLVLKDNPEKWEATPGNLLPIIVKAVQELKAENDELTIKNEQLASALVGLTIQNDELEIKNEKLSEGLHSEKIEKDGELSKLNEEISFLKSKVENVLSIEKELTKIDSLKEELIQQIQEMKSIKSEYELKFSSLKN
ncbi:MAG: hypothetical protein HND39_04270 [Ignavibacteriota bacterium]|nr:MAG: hypothetical protein EDM72_01185 [Chlorobiota bacterium]MBE7475474.1 tail fiber domain-containing protein [Ignavibacteriales bacterium]MBL1122441.1 hypothetical protein [Ignavibacteriota bacterium]MCE7856016.1 hypothetical protein [Ignavibacteria bacterium CHB3]MEB2297055.1 tail fiber domain-containing protein [Ignavibacteria bacterium]GJQ42065.1 MAG: hypothetical protein JETCAE03_15630 [Ignavibacteriaceae bacterium]